METKYCSNENSVHPNAGELLPITEFHIRNKSKGTYASQCKYCCRKRGRQYYNDNKEKMKTYSNKRYHDNSKEIAEKRKIYDKKFALYETYYSRLNYADECRQDPNNKDLIQVKCLYCNQWFNPTNIQTKTRIMALEGKNPGEHRLYCSEECKINCPTYKKNYYSAELKLNTYRDVQPELRKLVLERDNWTCIKCGSKSNLHCHHIEGIRWEPLESADIDKCITVCESCHKQIHKKDGCGFAELRCK